jgi:hypothetical protein
VASEVGGSKPTGTNSSEVMTGTVLNSPNLLHSSSSRRPAERTPAIRHGRDQAGPRGSGHYMRLPSSSRPKILLRTGRVVRGMMHL